MDRSQGAAEPRSSRTIDRINLSIIVAVVGFCVTTALAVASPWPTIVVSALIVVFGVAVLTEKLSAPWGSSRRTGLGAGVIGIYLAAVAIAALGAQNEVKERLRREAVEKAEAESARVAALRDSAPDRIRRAKELLANAEDAVQELDDRPMTLASQELAPLGELTPPPAEVAALEQQIRELNDRRNQIGAMRQLEQAERHASSGAWMNARDSLDSALPYIEALGVFAGPLRERHAALAAAGASHWSAGTAVNAARAAVDAHHADALLAEAAYDEALAGLRSLDGDGLQANRREVARLEARLVRLARRNERPADKLRARRAERSAQRDRCGARPSLSPWDNGLLGSQSYMRSIAHDPDSIDVERCTTPGLAQDPGRCWLSTCDVLGRNGFGAMTRNRMQFEVVDGRVVGATPLW